MIRRGIGICFQQLAIRSSGSRVAGVTGFQEEIGLVDDNELVRLHQPAAAKFIKHVGGFDRCTVTMKAD